LFFRFSEEQHSRGRLPILYFNEIIIGENMRLIALILLLLVAGAILLIKIVIGGITRNKELKNTNLKSETKNVMNKTAKGIRWMEEQWEESKRDAERNSKELTKDDNKL